ncbi:MAG: ATP-binding cassette domain-containing protein [Bdellovibrionales bacterium]|nr:ATP-binding cassette domain-containing protein [Bdellovibrionales bacterium]
MSSIELKQLEFNFGTKDWGLENINLSIANQESFVMVGPSGGGKTVLLKLMAGLYHPLSGQLFIEGQDFHQLKLKQQQALMFKMGMLFQKNALFDSLTVLENVTFPMAEVTSLSAKEIKEKALHFLEEVDLMHALDNYPDEISGGMQKRLGIARALALEPKIIFFDDPTAGLDPITSRKIVELMLQLKKETSATTVTITNDMNRAFQLADRIAVLVDQELIITGDKEKTLNHSDPRVHQFVRGLMEGPLTGWDS